MTPQRPSSEQCDHHISHPPATIAHDHASSVRHDSKVSLSTVTFTRTHQDYLDSLVPPTPQQAEHIAAVQVEKEEQVALKRLSLDTPTLNDEERAKAAGLIQRNYRGYRERREMQGFGLDPSSRWVEAIREARYRNLTQPRPRASLDINGGGRTSTESEGVWSEDDLGPSRSRAARAQWKKVGVIARRAAGDEDSDVESVDDEKAPEAQREQRHKLEAKEKEERQKTAKTMDLQYWLEMVDLKHRYGSNLRTYHQEWSKRNTHENFFYWLDYGEGKLLDCQGCPRERLDRERVRYLSQEERLHYLVKIDKDGRLCWAKNGARIDTTVKFKDSINGIVPEDDTTPAYAAVAEEAVNGLQSEEVTSGDSSASSADADHQHDKPAISRAAKYATPGLDQAKGMKKVKHVSAATIFNKLLRGSVKKNTWIFVSDTSFRLYVGIKQSGAFQHSSFLHGSRISAAGLIKIKDGQLDKLSPLSGHYRPPVSSFRAFVHTLKDRGVDMSHVSISRSYAVLVGLEAYVKTRRKGKRLVQALIHGRDKLLSPDELREREEEEMDKSESVAREKRLLEMQEDDDEMDENKANLSLLKILHVKPTTPKHAISTPESDAKEEGVGHVNVNGKGPESAIPPDGTRMVEQ